MSLSNYQMSRALTGETLDARQLSRYHVHLPKFFALQHWVRQHNLTIDANTVIWEQ